MWVILTFGLPETDMTGFSILADKLEGGCGKLEMRKFIKEGK